MDIGQFSKPCHLAYEVMCRSSESLTAECGAPFLIPEAVSDIVARKAQDIEANAHSKHATIDLIMTIRDEALIGPWCRHV